MVPDELFKNKIASAEKLLEFGFTEKDGVFFGSLPICKGEFNIEITVIPPCSVEAKVKDSAFGEEYVLHLVPDAKGAFVGKIREEYEKALESLSEKVFENDVFMTPQAKLCVEHVKEKYNVEPEYLWEKTPDNAIWRRDDNRKWFGAILTLAKNKIGLDGNEKIEILDLRSKPEELDSLIDGKGFFPGYHMNKKHWFTVILDGTVPTEEIFSLIEKSYHLAKKK